MSAHTSGEWLLLRLTVPIIIVQAIAFKRFYWNAPLKNGPGYFLGIKVSPGFYEGEGIRWLRRWRGLFVAANSVAAVAVLAIYASSRWYLAPAWAGGLAVLHVAAFYGFTGYARTRLGTNPPVLPSAVVTLEARRVGDYVSWRIEALIGAIIAFSWVVLLAHGGGRTFWEAPVVLTYCALPVLPLKIFVARGGVSLPADRPEEHFRWFEAARRYSLRTTDFFRWLCVLPLAGYALLHGFRAVAWLRWPLCGTFLVVWLYMVFVIFRGGQRMDAMGRDLVPPGSWSTPFRRAQLFQPRYLIWFGTWFGGLVLLLVFFHY